MKRILEIGLVVVFTVFGAASKAQVVSNITSSTSDATPLGIGDNILIQVEFSGGGVDVSGVVELELETGATDRKAVYFGGTKSNVTSLEFTYVIQAGDESNDLDNHGSDALSLQTGATLYATGTTTPISLTTPASSTNLASNKNLVVDGIAPVTPAKPNLANGSDSGSSNNDDLTQNTSLDFTGSYAENITLKLFNGASEIGVTTVSGGNYSFTNINLTEGTYTQIYLKAIDDAGNESPNSPNLTLVIDETGPSVSLDDDQVDNYVKQNDVVNITANFTEANGLDGTPKITIGSDVSGANMASTANPLIWTYQWTVPAGNNGAANVSINVNDNAGNTNLSATAGTGTTSYTIDNNNPSATVTVTENIISLGTLTQVVQVDYDEEMDSNTNPTVTIDGANWSTAYDGAWGTTGTNANDRYTVKFDHNGTAETTNTATASVSGSSGALDLAGNQANADSSPNFTIDTQRPSFVSAKVDNTNPNLVEVTFDEPVNSSTPSDFIINGSTNATIFNNISGSGGLTLTLTANGDVKSGEVITLSYSSNTALDDNGNNLNTITNAGITNEVGPLLLAAVVENATPNKLTLTFDSNVIISSDANFNLGGVASGSSETLATPSGSGTTQIVFDISTVVVSDNPTISYTAGGNAQNSSGYEIQEFSNFAVTNNVAPVPEPTLHVLNFAITSPTTNSLTLGWADPGGLQAPEAYLIVGIDTETGSFPTISDGNTYANDSDWSDGDFVLNLDYPDFSEPISGMTSGRNYTFRIYPYTNTGGFEDYLTTATVPEANEWTTTVSVSQIDDDNGGTDNGPPTISSLLTTKAQAEAIDYHFTFRIDEDGGSGNDSAPTRIASFAFDRDNADGTGDWTNVIAGVILESDGLAQSFNSEDNPGMFAINSNSIVVSNIPNTSASDLGYVADDADKAYDLKVWLRSDLATVNADADNEDLVFRIDNLGITLSNDIQRSSGFESDNLNSGNDNNKIDVIATDLYWADVSISPGTTAHQNFSVTVQAVDANLNIDEDINGLEVNMQEDPDVGETGDVPRLETAGSSNDVTENLSNGQFTRNNMQVHQAGVYIFRASASGLNDALTGPHNFSAGDALSDIVATAFDPPDNIAYNNFQEATINGDGVGDIKIAEFSVRDGGAINDSDGTETALTSITFDITNSGILRSIALHDGTSIIESQAAGPSVIFQNIQTINALDDNTKTFSVYVSFSDVVTDNLNFGLTISSASAAGSTFAAPDAGGASTSTTGDNNRIEVTSTQLEYVNDATTTDLFAIMSPVSVKATDNLGNIDLDRDNTFTVSLSSSGSLSGDPLSVNLNLGEGTFPDIIHSAKGTGFELTASLAGHTDAVSSPFDITVSTASTLTATAFVPPVDIDYLLYQAPDITVANSLKVGEFEIHDGGAGVDDGDGVGTIITDIELSLSNFENIQKVALYDGLGNELAELPAVATLNFSGLNYTAPDGLNSPVLLELLVTFNSAVTDNAQFVFSVTGITTSGQSSSFASFNASTPSVGSQNTIEVIATKLAFTTQPPADVLVNTNVSPQAVLEALDINNNRDLDYNIASNNLTVTAAGGMGLLQDPTSMNNGIVTFASNFRYQAIGDGQLTATASGASVNQNGDVPSSATSSAVLVRTSQSTLITAGGTSETSTINPVNDVDPGVFVFDFTLGDDDGAENDGNPTLVTEIIINQGGTFNSAGAIDWTKIIAGAKLIDDETPTANEQSGIIGPNSITFSSIPTATNALGYVGDNQNKTYTLQVWFYDQLDYRLSNIPLPLTSYVAPTAFIDGEQLEFSISDVSIATDPGNSGIQPAQALTSGDNNTLDVEATSLDFTIEPPAVSSVNSPYPVRVEARDANANRDLGFTNNLSANVSTTGNLDLIDEPTTADLISNGLIDFPANFQYNETGTSPAGRLLIASNGLNGQSQDIEVLASFDSYVTANNTALQNTINPVTIDGSDIVNNLSTDIIIGRFTLFDGGSPLNGGGPDVDGAVTRITDLDFTILGAANLKKIALYAEDIDGNGDGLGTFSEIQELVAGPTVNFEDAASGLFEAFDNKSRNIFIVASFQDTYVDNEAVVLSISNVEARLGGSQLNAAEPLPATPVNKNILTTVATQLDWISEPSPIQGINIPILPSPEVQARDAKGNLDVDFSESLSLFKGTNAAGVGLLGAPSIFSNGILDLSNLNYSETGNGQLTVVAAGGLNSGTSAVDVIHTTIRNLDTGVETNTENNNGIEGFQSIVSDGKNKAILGFRVSASQNTANQPELTELTVQFGAAIDFSLENIRLVKSNDPAYAPPETNVGYVPETGVDFVRFKNMSIVLDETEQYFFVIADILATANFQTPQITPQLVALGVPNADIKLSSGSIDANVNEDGSRSYGFEDVKNPEIYDDPLTSEINPDGLVPNNGDENFPKDNLISIKFNEEVKPLDSIITVYKLADNTAVSTLKLELASEGGSKFTFNPNNPVTGVALTGDTDYYINVPAGNFANKTGFVDITGFNNGEKNEFPGILDNKTWVFKTSDNVAPYFTTNVPDTVPLLPAQAVNVIDIGFDLRIALDEPGKIFYIVVDPNATPGTPTVDEIRQGSFLGTVLSGQADLSQGYKYHYINIFDDTVFPTASGNFRVWVTAEDFALPVPNKMVDFDANEPSRIGKIAIDDSFTAAPPNLIVQSAPNAETLDVCIGDYQDLFAPINIVEGSNGDFSVGTDLTITFALPQQFEYDTDAVVVTGIGGDITNVSHSFLNNTLLTITYTIQSTSNRDKLIISGLKVKALGSDGATGDIRRVGGTGELTSIPDNTTIATLTTFRIDPVSFITSPNTASIGNVNKKVLLTPDLSPLDKGQRIFTGPGVFADTLYTEAAGLGTHTITFNYITPQGCESEFSLDRTIFDSNKAIDDLKLSYCTDDGIASIGRNSKNNFILVDLKVEIAPEQDTVRAANQDPLDPFLTNNLGGVSASLNPVSLSYEFDPAFFRFKENFDRFSNENNTNAGGLIGTLLFTGVYQNVLVTTQYDTLTQLVDIYFEPTAELTIAGEGPYGDNEFDQTNITSSNDTSTDTLEFVTDTGLIELSGLPAPGGSSQGYFAITYIEPDTDTPATDDYRESADKVEDDYPDWFVDRGDGTATLDPKGIVDSIGYGKIKVKYIFYDLVSNCNDTTYQMIRINPDLVADYTTPILCENTVLEFSNTSAFSQDDIDAVNSPDAQAREAILPGQSGWSWGFDDPNASSDENKSDAENPLHEYSAPSEYDVELVVKSEFGDTSRVSRRLVVGGIPEPDFNFAGVSLGDTFTFRSQSTVVASSGIAKESVDGITFDFGDGSSDSFNDNNPESNNESLFTHQYTVAGRYEVEMTAISTIGCEASIRRPVIVLEDILVDSTTVYNEDYESGPGGWIASAGFDDQGNLLAANSWDIGSVNKSKIKSGGDRGNNIWVTGIDKNYDPSEKSYVFSPAFDLTDLTRPMIAFDIIKQLGEQDGVIFQYSTDSLNVLDPNKAWKSLGTEVDEGINWFNNILLAGSPGDEPTGIGWTGTTDTTWSAAKHDLGVIPEPEKNQVAFRFALGTIASDTVTAEGFAFDNAFMGNRTRTVLLENFTNMNGSSQVKIQNDAIRDLVNNPTGAELTVIQYHTNFDGPDPINKANSSDPLVRSLYYGIDDNPRVAIDGTTNADNLPYSEWGKVFYSQRTLNISPFSIKITIDSLNLDDGQLHVFAELTNIKESALDNFRVHVAVVENVVELAEEAPSGETEFYSVLRKLLPDAGGTKFTNPVEQGQTITINQSWNPTNLVNYERGAISVIVFIQDEETREVYQAARVGTSFDPVLGVFTSDLAEGITLYPNPADNRLTIELPARAQNSMGMSIYNAHGQLIEQLSIDVPIKQVDVNTAEYDPGVYLLRIDHPTAGHIRKKFIIKHR